MAGGKIFLSAPRRVMAPQKVISRKALVKTIKKVVSAELKQFDSTFNAVPIPTTTGTIISLSNIPVGDEFNERNGNWVQPITLRGVLNIKGNDGHDNGDVSHYRVGILIWNENIVNSTPTIANVMQNPVEPYQGYRIQGKGTFTILWARVGTVANNNASPKYFNQHRFSVKVPRKMLYNGGLRTKYHAFAFAYSNVDTAANPPSLDISTRLRYTDS